MAANLKEHPKVLTLVAVSAIVLIIGLAYTYWPVRMPDMPETMEDVPALLESKSYANLSKEQRRPYVQRVSELMRTSDREQRRAMMQNSTEESRDAMRDMFREQMLERVKAFALADAATQAKMIAEDRARFEAMGGGRRGPGGEGRGPRGEGGEGGERGGDGSRGDRPEPTEEERAERRAEHQSRVEDWVNEGNGQEWALIREYMQRVRPRRD